MTVQRIFGKEACNDATLMLRQTYGSYLEHLFIVKSIQSGIGGGVKRAAKEINEKRRARVRVKIITGRFARE